MKNILQRNKNLNKVSLILIVLCGIQSLALLLIFDQKEAIKEKAIINEMIYDNSLLFIAKLLKNNSYSKQDFSKFMIQEGMKSMYSTLPLKLEFDEVYLREISWGKTNRIKESD